MSNAVSSGISERKSSSFWKVGRLLIGILVLPLLAGGGLIALEERGFFNIDKVDTELLENGARNLYLKKDIADLNKYLDSLKGQSLWRLDLPTLSRDLSKLNWIGNFHILRVWPSTLRLEISPLSVPLVYRSQQGELWPLTIQGEFLRPVLPMDVPDVVILTGDGFAKKKNLRIQALNIIAKIPETGEFSRRTISEMNYDVKDGFWMNLMKSRIAVKLGEDNIAEKSVRVAQVIEYLDKQRFEARVIDANLSQKVLVRLRKDP